MAQNIEKKVVWKVTTRTITAKFSKISVINWGHFFLDKDEEPPEAPDLFEHILKEGREKEFIQFLILNLHHLAA